MSFAFAEPCRGDPCAVGLVVTVASGDDPRSYRGQMVEIAIGQEKVEYKLREGESLVIHHETEEIRLTWEKSGSPTYRRLTASADGNCRSASWCSTAPTASARLRARSVPRPISTP